MAGIKIISGLRLITFHNNLTQISRHGCYGQWWQEWFLGSCIDTERYEERELSKHFLKQRRLSPADTNDNDDKEYAPAAT